MVPNTELTRATHFHAQFVLETEVELSKGWLSVGCSLTLVYKEPCTVEGA